MTEQRTLNKFTTERALTLISQKYMMPRMSIYIEPTQMSTRSEAHKLPKSNNTTKKMAAR